MTTNPTSSIIKLNVGGKQFHTTASTLQGSEFFQRMLDGSVPTLKDESGAYFIDRDPKYFKIILSYLRTFRWDIPSTMEKNLVLEEAEFYMLNSLKPNPSSTPSGKYGLYTGRRECLFLLDGHCYWSALHFERLMKVNLQNNLIENRSLTGLFVNAFRSMIVVEREQTYLLDYCPPEVPSSVVKTKIAVPGAYDFFKMEANSEKVVVSHQTNGERPVFGESNYTTDNSTGLISASISLPSMKLNVKAYMFGTFVVLDVNGVWHVLKLSYKDQKDRKV